MAADCIDAPKSEVDGGGKARYNEKYPTKAKEATMANELKGKFIYYKTPKGNFNFRLKAPNTETIAVCEGAYTDLKSCKSGIESVRKFCTIDKIEDQTLQKGYETLSNPKFEIYVDKQGRFRYRLRANNGNLLCIAEEGYATKASCKAGIASVAKWAPTADLMSEQEFDKK